MAIDEVKYMSERVDDQIDWHDRKGGGNKKWFLRLQLTSLTCAALIPFISGVMSNEFAMRILVGGLGVVIAVVGGAISLNQFQKNWVDYRLISETLRGLKYRFETRTPPFDTPNAFRDFVEAVETALSEQHKQWQANANTAAGESEEGTATEQDT
jgi:hypothetical protein